MRRHTVHFLIGLLSILALTGCVASNNPVAQLQDYELHPIYRGVIIDARDVLIEDDGKGALVGGIVGAVAGHFISPVVGVGDTNDVIATFLGALGGMVVGRNLNEHIGQQLLIRLNNGDTYMTIVKGQKHFRGQSINVSIKNGMLFSILPSNT